MSKACNVSVPILLRRNTKEIKSLVQHYQWVRAEPSSKPRQSGFWAQNLGNLAEFHWSSGNLEAAGYLLAPAGSRLVLGMEEVKGSGSLAGWAHRILRGSAFSCYWLNCSRNCAFIKCDSHPSSLPSRCHHFQFACRSTQDRNGSPSWGRFPH